MSSKTAGRNKRAADRGDQLARPLQRLTERLRHLQEEAGKALDALKQDSAPDEHESSNRTNLGDEIAQTFSGFLERWDLPSRTEIDELRNRIEALEKLVNAGRHTTEKAKPTRKAASKAAPRGRGRPSKGPAKPRKPAAKRTRSPKN